MGASPAVGCSVWLAEHKVSYSRIWLWLHRAALLDYTTDLPAREGRVPEFRIGPSSHQGPAWHHEASDHLGAPQAGQFGRSEAEAKLHRPGLDLDPRTTVASCEAIRGPFHRNQLSALAG
jgi:hypothetical protein